MSSSNDFDKYDMIEKFFDLGCSNDFNASTTFYVLKDLQRRMYDVQYYYSESLGRLYLTAKQNETSPLRTYLPISSRETLPFSALNKYVSTLGENSAENSIVLAFYTADFKCIYYRITEGLPVD